MTKAVLPKHEIIRQVRAAILNFNGFDYMLEDNAGTNIALGPAVNCKEFESLVAEARFYGFPNSGKSFIEVDKPMAGLSDY